MRPALHIGRNPLRVADDPVAGRWVALDGEDFYQIEQVDQLRPFFLTVVSHTDLWMFISSTGALTAGRRSPDLALFPYYTEDKIHDSAEVTGSKTLVWVRQGGRSSLWEPFSDRQRGAYRVRRCLYKNTWGNRLIFEESNRDLGLTFRYGWCASDRFGWVRQAWLCNDGPRAVTLRLLDGVQNLMPCGVGSQFQLDKSNLLDAYKRNELLPDSGLALLRLSSIPIDRPEPAESLRTTVAWSVGLPRHRTLLSSVQLERFRQGRAVEGETEVRAQRGAYFTETTLRVQRGETVRWLLVADVNRGPSDVVELAELLRRPTRLQPLVKMDLDRGTHELRAIIASADGLQKTAWPMGDARHRHNVLFNVMRGGIFADGCSISPADLEDFVHTADRQLAECHAAFFGRLKPGTPYARMVTRAAGTGDAQLERLCREYLPLTFSRRHGDPSRPWNRFSIVTRKADGSRVLNYEGNWRDIFQNWEALAVSFPDYVAGMICRFVSASTADGYNPYRITRDGIDWEVVNPADPWAHIGYWGDHQLVYLLKLLEILNQHQPAALREFLQRDLFAYANVPYRIKPYAKLLQDPKETVLFDQATEELVRRRVQARGSDGRLVWDEHDRVRLVNLTEKLLVAVLAKLANFIPEAGLWLNTQRPEWNDANNALVGNGVSVVTLCYLRRYLAFCAGLFAPLGSAKLDVSVEVARFLAATFRALRQHEPLLARRLGEADRRRVLDDLGRAGSRYRERLYARGFAGERQGIRGSRLIEFFALALRWVDHSIRANRRHDGLYHAYNLVRFNQPGALPIRRLYEMLEGQVAVLSSGRLSPEESLEVLQALRRSAMFRADQHSYLLYPNRALPRYLEKNQVPPGEVRRSRLLRTLVALGDRSLIERDGRGRVHFSGALTNAHDVKRVLEQLAQAGHARLVERNSDRILELFERLFDHESFTGRSGTFFAYEGLGSIYWHMVSKLLLAVQETFHRAAEDGASRGVLRQLAARYHDLRRGLGDCKTPTEYGAFPMDPYSHTPAHTGARQPGLTGQVKEDFLCRLGELGVSVRNGRIAFRPRLLRDTEFLPEGGEFRYLDVTGQEQRLRLGPRALAFTYCQVPVVYRLANRTRCAVAFADGTASRSQEPELDPATSRSIFTRDGRVRRITIELAELELRERPAAHTPDAHRG